MGNPKLSIATTLADSRVSQNLSPARQLAVNDVQQLRVNPAQILTPRKLWATLDYSSVEHPDVRENLEWTVERAGTGHGIVVWFDTDLVEGIGFSNATGAPETVYGSLFFLGANRYRSSGIKPRAWALRRNYWRTITFGDGPRASCL